MATPIQSFYFASAAVAALMCSSSTLAASINYGDFNDIAGGGLVTFTAVTESSGTDPVPLYNAPTTLVDSLDFNTTSFAAQATDGSVDITDGQLNFGLVAEPGKAFSAIDISEAGDYTLAGSGTAATSIAAGLVMFVTIQEVDGVALASPVTVSTTVSDDADLANDAGIALPWDLSVGIDLLGELDTAGIIYNLGVTKADVVLNNTLLAFSEQGTIAFIAKKEFALDVTTEVPEPTTAGLALLALASLGLAAPAERLSTCRIFSAGNAMSVGNGLH
jgi:hypothetical protein